MSYQKIADLLGVPYRRVYKALNYERVRAIDKRSARNRRAQRQAYDRARGDRLRAPCPKCGEPMRLRSASDGRKPARCVRCARAEQAHARAGMLLMANLGASWEEIAAAFDSTPGSVKTIVIRERRALRHDVR